ncbi:DUF1365 domain-containing protein [Streptomyces sp. NBC_00503]|uniref:DUF1365 domain-containing protein n=1 Tax=Streptomyces sp. NBC_00503 TaxID=2903659 RepID=UPI002E81226F|nr:DUF1365 domain-containing protein [Streptomyces sp. NBC_00503]WUD85846.1 DUF1365 domain-containing protein [Streptomyces sp. NBC_00503]
MTPRTAAVATPCLYEAEIRHVRSGGSHYRIRHRTYLWLVDLDELPVLPGLLGPLARFYPRDHFGGDARSVRAGLDGFLAARRAGLPPGSRVLMLAHARVLGHVFNPLTVYWCHGPDGALRHVVAEVHNTYGERHCYLLPPETGSDPGTGPDCGPVVPKEFYVSPFLAVEGGYRMRLPEPGERLALTVRLAGGGDGARLTATVRGERRPADARGVLRAALRHPWSTAAVSAGIRYHGIRLWLRGLPVRPRPRHVPQEGLK